ncbi:7193_t:CDS:2, partial [Racocetra fulgida]
QKEPEIYRVFEEIRHNGNYYASKKCFFSVCPNAEHLYKTVDPAVSSFLAEKRIATAVPELHDCQVKCHIQVRKGKNKKKNRANHNPNLCRCKIRHECRQNWHIHLVISDFFPNHCRHAKCGLELGRGFKSPEAIVRYLAKYLIKNFRLRQDPEKAQKYGLLSGMAVYKFFRVGIKKPVQYSRVFINNEPNYCYQAEHELAPHFELDREKRLRVKRQTCQQTQAKAPPNKKSYSPIDFIKLCLATSSRATPIIRLEFEFNGTKTYEKFQTVILPALKLLNLPTFTKFADYQPSFAELKKYARVAADPSVADNIPILEIYNRIYLREIREEISG